MKHAFIVTLILLLLMAGSDANAQSMENSSYILELDSIDKQEPTLTPTPQKDKAVQPQVSPPGYLFPHSLTKTSLSLGLSTSEIDFGIITPTSPTERLFRISLTSDTENVILYTFQNHSLENTSKAIIPNTSCDNGHCSAIIASEWKSTLSFGLGFSCLSGSCDEDFNQERFRPFRDTATSIAEAELGIGKKEVLSIPIRVNVPGTQQPGMYENNVTFLVVPTL